MKLKLVVLAVAAAFAAIACAQQPTQPTPAQASGTPYVPDRFLAGMPKELGVSDQKGDVRAVVDGRGQPVLSGSGSPVIWDGRGTQGGGAAGGK